MTTQRHRNLDARRKRRKERVKARIREAKATKPSLGNRPKKVAAPAVPVAPKAPVRKAPAAKGATKATPPADGDTGTA